MMTNKPHILITGPIAPPFGGISIHIKRLCVSLQEGFNIQLVDESKNIKKGIFNIRSLHLFQYIKLVKASNLIFIHSGNRLFKKLHILFSKLIGKKTIITIHGYGNKRSLPFRIIDQLIFSMADRIILVNNEIHHKLSLPKEKCVVMHAFLPPDLNEEPPIPEAIQNDLDAARKNGKCIIVANASRLDTFNGEDLYGLDISVEAAIRMKKKNLNFCFIFTVSALDQGKDKYESALASIEKNGLQNDFHLHAGIISFPKLIVESDIVIRPTNTDGDSLSVREAIYFGKPIIASDAVARPEGTILFKTRNTEDLCDTVEKWMIQIKNDVTEPAHNRKDTSLFYSNLLNDVINKI